MGHEPRIKEGYALKLANNALKDMDTCSREGLPHCYKDDIQQFLADFYPDLPWEPNENMYALNFLTTDPEAARIISNFSERVSFDMMNELKEAIEMHGKE